MKYRIEITSKQLNVYTVCKEDDDTYPELIIDIDIWKKAFLSFVHFFHLFFLLLILD